MHDACSDWLIDLIIILCIHNNIIYMHNRNLCSLREVGGGGGWVGVYKN